MKISLSPFADYMPHKLYPHALQKLNDVVFEMTRTGVAVDKAALDEKAFRCAVDLDTTGRHLTEVAAEFSAKPPENWNSTQQLIAYLHTSPDGLKVKPSPFWTKGRVEPGKFSTDKRALEWLQANSGPMYRELFATLRKRKQQSTVLTYLTKLPTYISDKGRVHTTIGPASDDSEMTGTVTGRFSSKNPNLQQIPNDKSKDPYRIREAFKAPSGRKLVVADWSALEVVILGHCVAHLFDDDSLLKRIEPGAPDVHSATAKFVYGTCMGVREILNCPVDEIATKYKPYRNNVKAIRYGLNYGKGAQGFADTLFNADGTPIGPEVAEKLVDGLKRFDPGIGAYQEWIRRFVVTNGGITSLYGRWRPLPDGKSGIKGLVNRAWRQALNNPMQAGGAELAMNAALVMGGKAKAAPLTSVDPTARLVLQVHDEWVVECDENKSAEVSRYVHEVMTTSWLPFLGKLQATAGCADTWEEAK